MIAKYKTPINNRNTQVQWNLELHTLITLNMHNGLSDLCCIQLTGIFYEFMWEFKGNNIGNID